MKIHIVKQGESLYHIAQKYNVSLEQIIEMNPQIADPNTISVGQKVKVPAHHTGTGNMHGVEIVQQHVIKQGDTLWKLSKAWGVPLATMIHANPHLKNPSVLLVGEIVNIPKAKGTHSTIGHSKPNTANTGASTTHKVNTAIQPNAQSIPNKMSTAPAQVKKQSTQVITPVPVAPVEKPAPVKMKPQAVQKPNAPIKPQATQKPNAPIKPQATQKANTSILPQATQKANTSIQPQANQKANTSIQPQANQKANTSILPQANQKANTSIQPQANQKANTSILPQATQKANMSIQPQANQKANMSIQPQAELKPNAAIKPQAAMKPQAMQAPNMAMKPQAMQEPNMAMKPQAMQAPNMAMKPQAMQAPNMAMKPQVMQAPNMAMKPQAMQAPNMAMKPQAMQAPNMAMKPQAMQEPNMAMKPQAMQAPNMAMKPQAMQAPNMAMKPQAMQEPNMAMKPQAMQAPNMAMKPQAMEAPNMAMKPQVAQKSYAEKSLPIMTPAEKIVNPQQSEYLNNIELFKQYSTPATEVMANMASPVNEKPSMYMQQYQQKSAPIAYASEPVYTQPCGCGCHHGNYGYQQQYVPYANIPANVSPVQMQQSNVSAANAPVAQSVPNTGYFNAMSAMYPPPSYGYSYYAEVPEVRPQENYFYDGWPAAPDYHWMPDPVIQYSGAANSECDCGKRQMEQQYQLQSSQYMPQQQFPEEEVTLGQYSPAKTSKRTKKKVTIKGVKPKTTSKKSASQKGAATPWLKSNK